MVDLTHHAVSTFEEVQRWLVVGNRQRATAATSANERSSRSHAIFTITLAQSKFILFINCMGSTSMRYLKFIHSFPQVKKKNWTENRMS